MPEENMEKMKLMLVDDEEAFLITTKKLLERKGIHVTTASSGADALEILAREDVHVVILDVKMPGLDGVATLKAIKGMSPLVEVIMFTGHASVESAMDGLMSGATDYLTKPYDINDLVAKAEEAFARRKFQEEKLRISKNRSKTPDGSKDRG
jgi:DNA-binding NtrC family response regulator